MVLPRIRIPRISWRDLAVTVGPFVLLLVVAFWIALRYVNPAPPDTIVISTGPEGSVFQVYAKRYTEVLAREGVKLKILPSQGSLENLQRLQATPAEESARHVASRLRQLTRIDVDSIRRARGWRDLRAATEGSQPSRDRRSPLRPRGRAPFRRYR